MQEADHAKMLFNPDRIEVKRGEQVKSYSRTSARSITNSCSTPSRTTPSTRLRWSRTRTWNDDDPNGKRLAPNGSSEVVWRF